MSALAAQQARVSHELTALLGRSNLAGETRDQARRLLKRLSTPTRVSVMGLPGVGKTGVVNLLAGRPAIPEGLILGPIELRFGTEPKTEYTLTDGSKVAAEGPPSPETRNIGQPVMTRVELPLKALQRITLLDFSLPLDAQSQPRAMAWAAKRTDIAIWCTEYYLDRERALWTLMPSTLSDHAILLRTRADKLADQREQTVATLARDAAGEFAQIMAVSCLEASQAQSARGVDRDALRASGAVALVSAMLHKLDRAAQQTLDLAEVLIQKNKAQSAYKPAAVVQTPAPQPIVPDSKPKEAEAPPELMPEPVRETPVVEPDLAPSETVAVTDDALPQSVRDVFSDAVAVLESAGQALQEEADGLMDVCIEALGKLNERYWDDSLGDHHKLVRLRDMTQDAEDLIQLLQIEDTATGALDAVTAMLQLKRGYQVALAA